MKKHILATTCITLLLSACATTVKPDNEPQETTNIQFDRIEKVAYRCGTKKKATPIQVNYGVANEEIIAAQVKIGEEITPILLRDMNNKDSNSFISNTKDQHFTWVADVANVKTLHKTHGNMLTKREITIVNGEQVEVDNIIVKYCSLDRNATRKINGITTTKSKTKKAKKK